MQDKNLKIEVKSKINEELRENLKNKKVNKLTFRLNDEEARQLLKLQKRYNVKNPSVLIRSMIKTIYQSEFQK